MKPKLLPVLEMAVEEGVGYGYMRAHKHNENPSQEDIEQAIYTAVMSSLYEWFDFEKENGNG
jgi:hypothetical protein